MSTFPGNSISYIGSGSPGGKGAGLIRIQSLLNELFPENSLHGISIGIPETAIVLSDVFDLFVKQNGLKPEMINGRSDKQLSMIFCRSDFPPTLAGEIRRISNRLKTPLAVRSSSLTEDSLNKPFAGLFATKMIPNNNPDPDVRFLQLIEAVKFIYSSVWFIGAQDSFKAAGIDLEMEKMAVIIQSVHGSEREGLFYPAFSGVGRSYNYYPFGSCSPENGIVELAAGLGKTIVDGGRKWFYSPENPSAPPPASLKDMLDAGQTRFWAVNLRPPDKESPFDEKEFLSHKRTARLEKDKIIQNICSTYSAESDRLEEGYRKIGFKLIDFSPVLKGNSFRFNEAVSELLDKCREKSGTEVEIEFAVDFDSDLKESPRFAFLQIRPMKGLDKTNVPDISEFSEENLVVFSENVLGNAFIRDVKDFIYIKPDGFDTRITAQIPEEIEAVNRILVSSGRKYVLSGFGRWGTSDPAMGIPVKWQQISGASVIIESTIPELNPDLSQGSHFFHNVLNTDTLYFSIDTCNESNKGFIDYDFLEKQQIVHDGKFFKHIKFEKGIKIIADGRTRRGIISL